MRPKSGDIIACWFSCGAASAVAAKKTIEKYGDHCQIRVINNPVIEEHPDNQRFLRDCQEWLGIPIETATNPDHPHCSAVQIWEQRKYMSGIHGAPCTQQLKKLARQHWENANHHDWLVLGFTANERDRHDRFVMTERNNLLPILIDSGLSKKDCWSILIDAKIKLPDIYLDGFPNANCIGCVKSSSPTYWNLVREKYPDIFNSRSEQSRRLNVRLVKSRGERIFLDELSPDEKRVDLKGLDSDCSSFCEEKQLPLFYGNGT